MKINTLKIRRVNLIISSSLLFAMLVPLSANGAVRSQTAKTIQGSKPAFAKLVEDNINDLELLGVQFTDINGGSQ